MENKLQIGELAKLFGITTHAIRFYEKKNLIKPCHITDAGYRLYDYLAIAKLEEILMLRSIDMSIENIEAYYKNKTLLNYKTNLSDLNDSIDEKIKNLLLVKNQINDSLTTINNFDDNHSKLHIRKYNDRYLLFLKKFNNPFKVEIHEKEFYSLIKDKLKNIKLMASKDIVFLSKGLSTSIYLLINDFDLHLLKNNELFKLDQGDYLCGFHQSATIKEYMLFMNKVEKHINDINKKHENFAIDITSSDYDIFSEDEYYTYFQVKLSQ